MSKPTWSLAQVSNTNLGTFQERVEVRIELQVSDTEDRRNSETDQFFINVEHYATLNDVFIKSNGLATTFWLGEPAGYDQYEPRAQSYVFKFPAIRLPWTADRPAYPINTTGFIGVAIDGVPFKSPNSGKIRTIGTASYTENNVIYPVQYYFTDGSGIIGPDHKFYYQSNPTLLNITHTDGHSKIIGFAFDGLPIYGPYGYSDPLDKNSGTSIMRTSYRLKETQRTNGSVPDGTFIEDYEYVEGLGDLDEYNSRFCKTPEYPGGIQAYFATIDPDQPEVPLYPYIIGPKYFGNPILPNSQIDWPGTINIEVISGSLPGGLRISGHYIVGTPYEVSYLKTSRFVLRASNLDGVTDRTFSITIDGPDAPIWETPAGILDVGTNHALYILDNSFIEYQLSALDADTAAGQKLTYYVPPKGGTLPPGIILTPGGLLTGFTEPVFANDVNINNGNYDMNIYDGFPYDYGVRPYNGYDSFLYQYHGYDYSDATRPPKKLNRYYEFVVRASDGVYFADRKFRIFVVGDDHFRADNTVMQVGSGTFTADNTYLRKPIWLTPSNLGRRRANNYITIFLQIFDPATLQGPIEFLLENFNDDATPSLLPPGMTIDQLTGTIYGSVPYQPAITKTYKFTVRAIRYDTQGAPLVDSFRKFTLDVIGEVDSTIRFITNGDLGTIDANFISNLVVEAVTTVPGAVLSYNLVSGKIPPGLTLVNDGTLQGKVTQYPTDTALGLTSIDSNTTTFDDNTTTLDRDYMFTVEARDQLNLSAVTKTFKLSVNTPNKLLYSNIYVKPFLTSAKRLDLVNFLSDTNVFEISKLYRPSDINFGIQTEFKMLLYAGIETVEAAKYAAALGRASKKRFRIGILKKAVAKKPATNDALYEVIYLEVIDSSETMIGSVPSVINTNNLKYPISVNQGRRDIIDASPDDDNVIEMGRDVLPRIKLQDKSMSADFGGQLVSDRDRSNVFGNSVFNIRKNIEHLGDTERNYLPLWMRTAQTSSGVEQGFTKAIPICYCLPGQADSILLNIRNANFDFKKIDFTVDRIIIDSVAGESGDKYIAFAAREVING
jgi:hypothetical protein